MNQSKTRKQRGDVAEMTEKARAEFNQECRAMSNKRVEVHVAHANLVKLYRELAVHENTLDKMIGGPSVTHAGESARRAGAIADALQAMDGLI